MFFSTAAHCIQDKKSIEKKIAENVVVYVGKHNLSDPLELSAYRLGVSEIRMHSDWISTIHTGIKFDSDIALLMLNEAIHYSHYAQPVCLPKGPSIDRSFDGFVVSRNYQTVESVDNFYLNILGGMGPIRTYWIKVRNYPVSS